MKNTVYLICTIYNSFCEPVAFKINIKDINKNLKISNKNMVHFHNLASKITSNKERKRKKISKKDCFEDHLGFGITYDLYIYRSKISNNYKYIIIKISNQTISIEKESNNINELYKLYKNPDDDRDDRYVKYILNMEEPKIENVLEDPLFSDN